MSEHSSADLDMIGRVSRSLVRLSGERLHHFANLCFTLQDAGQISATLLQRELGLSTGDATSIVRAIAGAGNRLHPRDLAVMAMACAQKDDAHERGSDKVDIVCTGPIQFAVPVRATFATMMELVHEANSEVMLLGYVFTAGAVAFVREVANARRRGVGVTIIGNQMRKGLAGLRKIWGTATPPALYSWENDGKDGLASFHAKILICDRRSALVTSANYSLHGLHENIEIGVRVQSASVTRLSDFARHLITSGAVRPLTWE